MKKKILITRKLLKENEDKLKELFDVKLNDNDEIYSSDKIIELLICVKFSKRNTKNVIRR